MTAIQYPECEKMKAVHEKSQTIGEFLEWLQNEKGVLFSERHHHDDGCYDDPEDSDWATCGYTENSLAPLNINIEKVLAEYYDIDLKKVDAEKDQMLNELRKNQ
jgi:hypothetical protein